VTNGSTLAASGVTLANDFTIGSAGGLQSFYSQNFNSMGTSATASLPTDWKMSAAGQGTTGTFWTNTGNFAATSQAASSGSPNSGGRYNWGFSNDANNRAVGFMSSGSYAEPNSIMFAFTNTTGQTITDFTVSFDYLRFRTNSTAISNVFYMSDSSTSWGSAISTNVWAAGTSGYNFAPAPVSLTNTISLTITNGGVAYMMWTFDATTAGNSQGIGLDNVSINTPGGPTGSGTLGISEAGTATFSGNILNNTAATFTAASGGTATFSGIVSGAGTLSKTGIGTVTLSGASANTFAGTTTVSAGTLELNKTADVAAIAGDIEVNDGAFLLLSSSGNVSDTAEITLSGGTITRGAGVSEVFGALTLNDDSFLDFGTGATGTLSFTSYTPSALLTVNNFLPGNKLTFTSNLSTDIENSALFSFGGEFQWDWDTTTPNTFTITAIPEPSTYLAAAGLLSLMLWPSRKRIIRDTKKILGLRPPMRDRLAAKRA
jgi:autotransporter-associated beta strand protein